MSEPGDKGALIWYCPCRCTVTEQYGSFPPSQQDIFFWDFEFACLPEDASLLNFWEFGKGWVETTIKTMTKENERQYGQRGFWDYGIREGQKKRVPHCPKCDTLMTLDVAW